MSWVAVAVGVGRAAYGAIDANQKKQKNKGAISAAYRQKNTRLTNRQTDVDTSAGENLAARGLLQGGGGASAIRAAMVGEKVVSTGPAPTDLGGQARADLGKEFAYEREDLTQQEKQAQNANKAAGLNAEIGAVKAGVNTATQVYGMKGGGAGADIASAAMPDIGGLPAAGFTPSAAPAGAGPSAYPMSAIRQVYSGIDDPNNSWGGIHPVDPLNHPTSSWNRVGGGEANVDFNVGS